MSVSKGGDKGGLLGRPVPELQREASARAARTLDLFERELGVVVQEIPLDAIEPDPGQPRRTFDEGMLQSLATSIRKYGVLQEPGVIPVGTGEKGGRACFRLIWGERRWRASRLAGLTAIRCKVLPRGDDSAVEQLQTKERQWAENMEREGHSPIEEAIAIQDAVDLERKLDPEATVGDVVEKVGAERGLNGIVARNLVGLLKAPRSLQSAMMGGAIGRELGFELMRFWNKLLADNALRGEAKREIQYRNLVEAWARARGAEIDAATMRRYATETFQDPQVVKATCRKAEDSQRALVERFDALVAKVQREGWTVARAKAELPACRRNGGKLPDVTRLPCFERGGKGNARLIVYLDRVREPTLGNPAARAELLGVLRSLVAELETGRASSQPTGSQAAHPAWMRPRL